MTPGVGVAVGVLVAVVVAVGFAVASAATVACAEGVAVGLLSVQPVVALKTSAQINNSGSAYFNGILTYRFIIRVIGVIFTIS
jgi:hypothetical protein